MRFASAGSFRQRRRAFQGAAALACFVGGALSAAAFGKADQPDASDLSGPAISFLEKRIREDPADVTALNRLSELCLGRFRRLGRYSDLENAARTAALSLKSIPEIQNSGGLMAHAKVEAEYHRFGAARDEARRLIDLAPKPTGAFLVLGDALFELGQPDEALAAWREAARGEELPIELPMREARFHWLRGEVDAARADYAKVLDAINRASPAQPQAAVWAYVQRGQLSFGQGDWDGAEKDYQEAARIAPDGFSVLDHLAELRAAQKRYPEAVAMYERVIGSTGGRPEFMQALGDVQAAAGDAASAKQWHDRALSGYLESVQAGNGHYYHHLAGFYCDVAADAPAALKWARKDLEGRQSVYAYDALAWALYAGGDWTAAAGAAAKSLALGTPDAHLIFHAGMIYSRAGDLSRGGALLRRAAVVNPRYFNSFHVHR